MKKLLSFMAIIIALGFLAYLTLDNEKKSSVKYSSTTTRNVKILKIDQNESSTRIDFKLDAVRDKLSGFTLSSKNTYLENSKNGERFNLISADGIKLDTIYSDTIFENIKYTLIFESIDKSVETIDFIAENTKIFDIELVPQVLNSIIPAELQGNWLKTDGSNEWIYGFYDNVIIYENNFWYEFSLAEEEESYVLSIQKDDARREIYIKKSGKNSLLIGDRQGNLEPFSKEKTKNYIPKNDIELNFGIFKEGFSIYKGFIHGYHPKMNWAVKVYVPDVISNEYPEYTFKIKDNGTFLAEIPMDYPEKVFVRIGNIDETVFLKPNNTTLQYIDLLEHNAPYKTNSERITRKRESLFMGDMKSINNEMKSLDSINYFDNYKMRKEILKMSPSEYKEYCLDISKKELSSFKKFLTTNLISQQTQQIKEMEISFRASEAILSYEINKRSARSLKEMKNSDNLDFDINGSIEMENEYPENFFDFLNINEINDKSSLITGTEYYFLINRLKYGPKLIELGFHNYFEILKQNFKRRGINLTRKEQLMLEALLLCITSEEVREITRRGDNLWKSFKDKYGDLFAESVNDNINKIMDKNREKLYGISNGFAKEIMFAQDKANFIRQNQVPFHKWILKEIESNVSDENLKRILLKYNKLKELENIDNIKNKDYFIHETPKVEKQDLFYTIISKHKGKAILVDFWATWCGPCLKGFEDVKPFKIKLKNKLIEFVYITDHSSPIKTYEAALPGIKGHHYRLNKEQWAHLSKAFNITSIPHYIFIDKHGNIIEDELHFPFYNGKFEKLIKEHL